MESAEVEHIPSDRRSIYQEVDLNMTACIKRIAVSALFLGAGFGTVIGQGTIAFRNLDFEAAAVPDLPENQFGGEVAVSEAIPGWAAYIGSAEVNGILHNNRTLSSVSVSIYGPNWFSNEIIQGSYTVALLSPDPVHLASIGQIGRIPVAARSLKFETGPLLGAGAEVAFAGVPLELVHLGEQGSYEIYGVDVTAIEGKTAELRFSNIGLLDNIYFSAEVIPEPGAFKLLLAGCVGLFCIDAFRRRRRPRNSFCVC